MDPGLLAASAALNEGRRSEAADLLVDHLSRSSGQAPRNVYAITLALLMELGRTQEGLVWSERAVAQLPRDYEILNRRGALLRLANRQNEAVAMFDRATKVQPGEPAAQINKAMVYNDLGKGEAAEAIFNKLLRQHPKMPIIHRSLARALSLQNKFDAAEARLRQALSLDARDVDAWLDLSALAADQFKREQALDILERAIEAVPDDQRLLRAKAVLLRVLGRDADAQRFLELLLSRQDDIAWAHREFGALLMDEAPERSLGFLRQAVRLAPGNREFRAALAEALFRLPTQKLGTNLDEAFQWMATMPISDQTDALEAKIRAEIMTQVADYAQVERVGDFRLLAKLWTQPGFYTALLHHMSRVKSADDRDVLLQSHRLWGKNVESRAAANPIRRSVRGEPSGKIRIGFMSSDLRAHPVTYFAWPLFQHVDRERFEIYCYSWYRGSEPCSVQQKLSSMVDVFRWHPEITDRDAAQLIADDDLDILFELGGATHMNKLEVMAWKPARLTASWLGYPHSAGLDNIDYMLVDPLLNPTNPKLLIEKPLVMPHSWLTMGAQAFSDDLAIEPVPPVQRNGFITFGTANNPYKYSAAMLGIWAKTMKQLPNSRFIFVRSESGSNIFVQNIRSCFEAEGVAADRIEFRAVRGDHMKHYNDIDIALDTFPQTGGTTTCEALWMGVPTVTLVGEAIFERMSYSILSNAGLGDLCATSPEEFVDIALGLADQPARIQNLRANLRDRIGTGPLGQTEQFAKDFYALISAAVENRADSRAFS